MRLSHWRSLEVFDRQWTSAEGSKPMPFNLDISIIKSRKCSTVFCDCPLPPKTTLALVANNNGSDRRNGSPVPWLQFEMLASKYLSILHIHLTMPYISKPIIINPITRDGINVGWKWKRVRLALADRGLIYGRGGLTAMQKLPPLTPRANTKLAAL
ncbi:hypothetical protein EVAR_96128_1 [Eumeta japonica]|uniref:Uncharacterized protein n=1 Tax=Eumeta variegata TaxID=151549 RepID=A0A4C2A0T0_EUMVA|nr:hypothetical protein EVAR_96128_1 [Eumeta japonica]